MDTWIKSPLTNRMIKKNARTYRRLVKMGIIKPYEEIVIAKGVDKKNIKIVDLDEDNKEIIPKPRYELIDLSKN